MEVGDERQLEFLREWQHKVWSAGYLGMAWPKQYGGGGMPRVFQAIADQESREWLAVVRGALLSNDNRLKDVVGTLAAEGAANEARDLIGVMRVQSVPARAPNDEAERRLGALGPAGSDVSRPGADGDSVAKHRPTKAPTRH